MKKITLIPIEVTTEIICDRCAKCVTKDCAGTDWYEMQSIAFTGGFDSIFGDGNKVSIDLCPQCLKDTLGPWLHIAPQESWLKIQEPSGESLGKYFGVLKGEIKAAEGPVALPSDVPPPKGYQSWLHYAVETMETRSLEIENLFEAGKSVSREEMRAAVQKEIRQLLKGSVLKYEDPTNPIT